MEIRYSGKAVFRYDPIILIQVWPAPQVPVIPGTSKGDDEGQ